ncbi:MAG TPA: carboxylate-amine ligase [Ferrovibrio sp.]|uniref:carboxylate-amine ligase n=1 Tax=Ferrovibrio sp. TaxID=1917215 RepID=UPI002B4AE597|nr:carboxylate-amine ligase [Ferrovibrio sp.]HLT77901.1 carboxylate-amine ligase [Ferrovibrio sp.]
MFSAHDFTIGIEEEHLLVEPGSGALAVEPPEALLQECSGLMGGQINPEFLRCQIEVSTRVCGNLQEVRADLVNLRKAVSEVASRHGLAPIAASTHPFGRWSDQRHSSGERYDRLARDLAGVARRLIICGMHVHVGIPDEDLRIDLMNQVSYFLPHLLALSTSSPFWQGEETGLQSFRLSVFDSLPRTGLPERFESWGEYQRMVNRLMQAGLIEDATKLWWDIRPSARYPTLEMRVTDVCTRLDDGISVTAMFVCLLAVLLRLKQKNQRWRVYANTLIDENRWLAQRYGTEGKLVDFGKGEATPYADLLEELIELTREEAQALGCLAEVERTRGILKRGTSAQRQLQVYRSALDAGADKPEALKAVVDWLIAESMNFTIPDQEGQA